MQTHYPVTAIARLTLLEALRTRIVWVAVTAALGAVLAAEFAAAIAVTEAGAIRIGVLAALLRLAGAGLIAVFVVTSQVREFSDQSIALALSRPVTRTHYYLGRWLGCAAIVAAWCVMSGALVFVPAAAGPALVWSLSLALELLVLAAFSLACVIALPQVPIALGASAAFYVLARAIGAIALMSSAPLVQDAGSLQQAVGWLVSGIAFVLPGLWRFTQSAWLMYGDAPWHALAGLATEAAIYLLLLAGVTLFDLHRKAI